MFGWRRARRAADPLEAAFRRTLRLVEEGRAALMAAAPTGRPSPVPLAEAVAAFEQGLAAASWSMEAWRSPETEGEWTACRAALEESGRRAARLRLELNPQGYEELVEEMDHLLEPLDAFRTAAERLRRTGAG